MSESMVIGDMVQGLLKVYMNHKVKVWVGGAEMSGELLDCGEWGVLLKRGEGLLVIPAMHLHAFQADSKAMSAAKRRAAAERAVPLDTGSGRPVPEKKRPGP